MSNVINKKTGQYLVSVHTPDYMSVDWIVNPTKTQITKYTPEPVIIDPKLAEKEQLIQDKIRVQAIDALKIDGVLNSKGELV